MRVFKDANGRPAPELDWRDVPLSVMAEYLGIERSTLWRRTKAGMPGTRKIGDRTYYKPAVFCGAAEFGKVGAK